MPALVVPAVAATANTEEGSASAASTAASASPVRRSSLPDGTTKASQSSIRSVLRIEECAVSPTATRQRPAGRPWRAVAVSRAANSAERLPADPPETKQPPAAGGIPARSARTRRTWFSAYTAPDASSHDVAHIDDAATTVSNTSDAFVGAAGMNARNRGLSVDRHAGASTSVKIFRISSGGRPPLVIAPPACASSSANGTG